MEWQDKVIISTETSAVILSFKWMNLNFTYQQILHLENFFYWRVPNGLMNIRLNNLAPGLRQDL